MKRIKALLLACLMMFSMLSLPVSANDYDIMPIWENTNDVLIIHGPVGTTACCQIDMNIARNATIEDVEIRLIDVTAARVVKRWYDPEFYVDAVNTHSFYGEVPNITLGHVYDLYIYCKVYKNGVYDEISLSGTAQY